MYWTPSFLQSGAFVKTKSHVALKFVLWLVAMFLPVPTDWEAAIRFMAGDKQ